ncbi:helix-turn-helix transcriptional regulator [uncultured Dysosmobacter sp.]|uniref:helix-turn-helix domain-containing protein n=1 Tax=uncultured Dysosmobacter sp. TaxID=2591384 RepID=UPI002621FB47|nr:helix-turn-helix transcriptional regulator [uncultured Dysosmobacter sp.]
MIRYIDILQKLKEAGYSTYRIRKEGIFGGGTMNALTAGTSEKPIDTKTLDKICTLTGLQPGDLLEYVPDIDQPAGEQKSE